MNSDSIKLFDNLKIKYYKNYHLKNMLNFLINMNME